MVDKEDFWVQGNNAGKSQATKQKGLDFYI